MAAPAGGALGAAGDQMLVGLDGGIDVQPRDAAGRALQVDAQHHRGPVVDADHAAGHQPQHAAAGPRQLQHQGRLILPLLVDDLLQGPLGRGGLAGHARLIVVLQRLGQRPRLRHRVGHQQVQRVAGMGHAPRGVDAGPQRVADVAGAQALRVDPGPRAQGHEAGAPLRPQARQAQAHQGAVVRGQGTRSATVARATQSNRAHTPGSSGP